MIQSDRVPGPLVPLFESLGSSPDAVFVTDRHNHIVYWNRSAERIFGFTEGEASGADCHALLEGCDGHGNRYCSESCPVTRMAARGEPVRSFALRLRAKDGSTVALDVSILHFEVSPSDGYYLAHILKPPIPAAGAAPEAGADQPPRSRLAAVRESSDARARKLTPREVDVLGMLAAGVPTAGIAARLHISNFTARNHLQNILDKLEVHSKAEAVAFAFQKRIL